MRLHVREPRRRHQRHVPRARAGQPQQPEPPVPVHVPGPARPARARRVPHLRPPGKTARVCHYSHFKSCLLSPPLFTYVHTTLPASFTALNIIRFLKQSSIRL